MKKRILALFLCLIMAFTLVACGGDGEPSSTDSNVGSVSGSTDSDAAGGNGGAELKGYDPELEHKVICCDIKNHGVVILDLNACNYDFESLEACEEAVVWEWDADEDPNCELAAKVSTSISGVRYRYSEYYKKDVIVACAAYGWVGIIDYETRSLLWEADDKVLNNAHSVEMLPNGDVVVAVSADPGAVVYYPLSAGITDPIATVPSLWSHGVFWDPEAEQLWVLETSGVVAVSILNRGTENVKLMRVGGMGVNFKGDGGGHAFAPIMGQPGKYWASGGKGLWVFDSEKLTLTKADKSLNVSSIKGVCSFTDGTVVEAKAGFGGETLKEFGSAGLRITVKEVTGNKVKSLKYVTYNAVFKEREFYKVQTLTKDYR